MRAEALRQTSPVPVIGIGASAGGLDALEEFLASVPLDSGRAYVVVQHLDPTHASTLPEILQRATILPVQEAGDSAVVRPDNVYVIPPGKDLALCRGRLILSRPLARRGLRLPVDVLFNSLAAEQADGATGVVLSGMGHDGTVGLRAIKEAGGRTFAQLPTAARFGDMPRSAIEAGVADVVAPAGDLPGHILRLRRGRGSSPAGDLPSNDQDEGADLHHLLERVRTETGRDFSEYKPNTILRRIERRMSARKLTAIADYVVLVEHEPSELRLLAQALLIGVTSFFRDPVVWERLADSVLPKLLAGRPAERALRAWVPGCSTGEEAYSLAIALLEAMERSGAAGRHPVRIFATDIDADAIDTARQGLYPLSIAANVSAERLQRFFIQEEQLYRVRPSVRELLVFSAHDVITDPPFTKLDLLSCRNLMIYLSPELQHKLFRLFHYSLNPGGVLVLGTSETLSGDEGAFATIDTSCRLYRRLPGPPRAVGHGATQPASPTRHRTRSARPVEGALDAQALSEQALIRHFAPPAVVINDDGDILHILGRVGKYLEPSSGKASLNVYGMARAAVRRPLAAAVRAVVRGRDRTVVREDDVSRGGRRSVRVTAKRLATPPELRGLIMAVFEDVVPPRLAALPRSKKQRDFARALRRAEREAETLRAETRSSREQLSSANEELQSMNEELQSANEELTTSKEETQSMNEELQSVNTELQSKLDNLALVNSDLKNLLDSTDIATVFLDADLKIRRFTRHMTRVARLIQADVGRPLTDIKSDLIYQDIETDVRGVLRTLIVSEKQVTTADGRWYAVRIMPYRTLEDTIDGAVITFTDISTAKHLELELRKRSGVAAEPAAGQGSTA